MARSPKIISLPESLECGLLLVETGHALRTGEMVGGILPQKVLDFFNRLEEIHVDWVMVGAMGLNLYTPQPRATGDVDIVVRKKHLRKVRQVLKEWCEELEESKVHYKGSFAGTPVPLGLDVIKSQSHPLFELALDHQVSREGVRVPKLEALLALKYLSAVSPWRPMGDKHIDLGDFIRAYKHNLPRIDRALLIELASLAHKNAPEEFPRFLEAVENDRPITI